MKVHTLMTNLNNYYLNLNLSYLKDLRDIIYNTDITTDFKISSAENGMPVLNINGVAVNSTKNPLLEAHDLFKNVENSFDYQYVVFGTELGYALKFACEKYKGDIIIFDKNIESIKYLLQNSNLIEYIAKPNLHLVVSMDKLKGLLDSSKKHFVIANDYYSKEYADLISQV